MENFESREKQKLGSFLKKPTAGSFLSLFFKHLVEGIKNIGQSLTPKVIFFIVLFILIIAIFGKNIKNILLVFALAVAASYSTIYKRTFRVPSAVELVTFGTVITGAAYGPVWGVAFGVITTFASEIISSGVDVNTVFYAVARGLAGGFAFTLLNNLGLSVLAVGMVALAIFNIICQPIYLLMGDVEAKIKGIYYFIVNTIFNLIVFSFLGNFVLSIAKL